MSNPDSLPQALVNSEIVQRLSEHARIPRAPIGIRIELFEHILRSDCGGSVALCVLNFFLLRRIAPL